MIPFEEARRIILENTAPGGTQRRALPHVLGMVLAEPIQARFPLPRFDNSAVDGYGVKIEDVRAASAEKPVTLELIGTIQAGDAGNIRIQPGQTVKILTGAPVPKSVDAVIMQEDCQVVGSGVRVLCPAERGENIRRQGEEFRRGQPVIAKNTIITPPVVGLLASLGYASVKVYKRPKVGLVSTGNELIRPGKPLAMGQIYDSNSYALSAALRTAGIESMRIYHVKDERNATQRVLEKALRENDAVISLGGVSVGEFDFVKDVAEQLGIRTLFWRIAIKPGKPVYFGLHGKRLVFGLPGNPVSALVTYHQLVQPALRILMGYPFQQAVRFKAVLSGALRKKAGRQEFVRGFVTYDGAFRVRPAQGQDSHMLGGLAAANCLIDFPLAEVRLQEDDLVDVELLSWSPYAF
jgi:molybdopterin molybdotransferase